MPAPDWIDQPHTHAGTDCPGDIGCPARPQHRHLYEKDLCPDGENCVNKAFGHPVAALAEQRLAEAEKAFSAVKDSGERREWSTGSVRDVSTGKGRFDLLPMYSIKRLAQHYENGAAKYGDRNWEKGQPLHVYIDSALRHGFCVSAGMQDEDHAAAAAWNWFAFIWTAEQIRLGKLPAELDTIGWVKGIDSVGPTD